MSTFIGDENDNIQMEQGVIKFFAGGEQLLLLSALQNGSGIVIGQNEVIATQNYVDNLALNDLSA